MADLKSMDEIVQETIYNWLWKEFSVINDAIQNEEAHVNLDGVLWKLSRTLTTAGMWKALQDSCGIMFDEPRIARRQAGS